MTPITPVFPKRLDLDTTMYAKNQPEYNALPAFKSVDGRVTTRWKLTLRERFKLFLNGNLWLTVLTFNKPLQPIKLETQAPYENIN